MIIIFYFQYESETPVKKAPPTSLSFVSLKDQGKEQAKDSTRRSSRSKPLRKKKSGSTSANMDTPGSDDVAKELGAKSEKGEGPGGGGEEQEVWSQEDEGAGGGKVPAEVSEDVRKTEDSLAVINRHAEAEDEKVRTCTCIIIYCCLTKINTADNGFGWHQVKNCVRIVYIHVYLAHKKLGEGWEGWWEETREEVHVYTCKSWINGPGRLGGPRGWVQEGAQLHVYPLGLELVVEDKSTKFQIAGNGRGQVQG